MISIDITDTQIKLVEATTAGKISVRHAALRDLPMGCIENGRIVDMHIVAGEITDILVTEKIKDREAIMCINSGMILYREMVIPKPKQTGNDGFVVESIIQNEMSLGNDYNITYSVSEEFADDGGPKMKVIAAACPQNIVDTYLQLARQTGLKTKLVTVSNTCITRLVKRSTNLRSLSPLLLLQVDRTFINISLYNKGAVVFSRHTKIDASDYGNSEDYINLAIFDNVFRIMHLIDQNQLASEVREIHYFGTIDNTAALHATIGQLNLTAVEFDCPTDLIRKRTIEEFLPYVNIMGSFLKIDYKTENINLLNTREKKIAAMNMRFGAVAFLAGALTAFLVGGTWVGLNLLESSKNRELSGLEIEFINTRYSEMQAYVALKELAMGLFDTYVYNVETARVMFEFQPKMTADIARHIDGVLLPGMSVEGEIDVNGYELSLTLDCTNPMQPAAFVDTLYERGYFENIEFTGYSYSEEDNRYSFDLRMRIKGGNIFES